MLQQGIYRLFDVSLDIDRSDFGIWLFPCNIGSVALLSILDLFHSLSFALTVHLEKCHLFFNCSTHHLPPFLRGAFSPSSITFKNFKVPVTANPMTQLAAYQLITSDFLNSHLDQMSKLKTWLWPLIGGDYFCNFIAQILNY